MSKSCHGLLEDFVKCLSESECMQVGTVSLISSLRKITITSDSHTYALYAENVASVDYLPEFFLSGSIC